MPRVTLIPLFLCSLFLFCGKAWSEQSPDFRIIEEDGQTILDRYCGSEKDVTIPKGVTRISSHAFSYSKSITSVVIPEGVTKIEDWTFSKCDSLKSVVRFPKG